MTVLNVHQPSSPSRVSQESEPENEPSQVESLLGPEYTDEQLSRPKIQSSTFGRRALIIRILALLCACCLSIGSHYASYILGPLKSRIQRELGTTHTEFGLLFSAYSLNSTWTPLIGGLLASKLGTTFASILATSVVFMGQALLLVGDLWGNVRLMALGLFIFGFGVSPLAVVQETIIVRYFKSHGIGVPMAFGLIAGKGASFIAARTSYPLAGRYGSHAPFYVATFLAGLSVIINLVYVACSDWLVYGSGAELEAADMTREAQQLTIADMAQVQALEKLAEKHKVHLRQIIQLGDVFWAYIALNVLCGAIWSPFIHLAPNIIEKRYDLTEQDAATKASYLLVGSLILYPFCGFLVDHYDRRRPIIVQLLFLSSALTAAAYMWMAVPPGWTHTPVPAILSFAVGHGFSPLLLVVVVPRIVRPKYISTALGAHKSLEQTGSILFQTLAGLALDVKSKEKPVLGAIQRLLNIFLFLNALHFGCIALLAYLQWCKDQHAHSRETSTNSFSNNLRTPDTDQTSGCVPETSLISCQEGSLCGYDTINHSRRSGSRIHILRPEIRRGQVFATLSFLLVVLVWVLFLGIACYRLGEGKGGHGGQS